LFANYVKPWNDHGYEITCPTIRNLINSLVEVKPKVQALIDEKIIPLSDFDYIEYNGTEIIP